MSVTAGAPLLEVESLTYRYRRATEPAIRDLNLTVNAGEVVLVAGPSGCGKSTLIRAINGLIPHAYPGELTGSVKIDGRLTTELKLRDIALTVGTVLQDPAKQIVGATVEAELAFGPENLGVPRDEIRSRIAQVITRAGIADLVGRETSALSGGEKQLVATAGTLIMQPRLYVVDEPLANLDPATAERLLLLLRELADRGDAVVIVEHRVEEALDLRPDRVLYLDEGRERYQGPLEGFLKIADPEAVKLPFSVVLERVRAGATPDGRVPPDLERPVDRSLPPRLEFRGVRAGYGGREVLRGIDARFERREIVAVLGPNGSGKTTLFRTAMHLMPITAGGVLVDGGSIADRKVADLATVFGYVFQSPSQMLFARTVREELVFGPRNLGRDPTTFEAIIADALRRTSLDTIEDILERPPLTLSFGQQKRLALAIALALQPPTLILDEPSAGQDHRTSAAFMREVLAIPGLESLYLITHDVDLALTHADRILLFREGEVVADGPPIDVIRDEARWVACNLRPTSLLRANLEWRARDGRFLSAEALARRVIEGDRRPARAEEGRS
ncbi:MAG: energy-coupling factor ABC transporter ATP-binding protein [Chloroflexota bacterium]|nr:energy-coupling factor ABC transporter ATP-binding protein [Chloroflexota bacterium]